MTAGKTLAAASKWQVSRRRILTSKSSKQGAAAVGAVVAVGAVAEAVAPAAGRREVDGGA